MERSILDQKHESYDSERWEELDALAKGGKRFHALIDKFLPRNPMEPDGRYFYRKRTAKYLSYVGPIINLYSSWLFIAGFDAKPYERDSTTPIANVDPWYGSFQENVGSESTMKAFMKDRFRDAMTVGKGLWLIELPQATEQPADRAEWEAQGLGNAKLTSIDAKCLFDWECDDKGQLVYAIIFDSSTERASWQVKRDTIVERWRVYDRENVTIFENRRQKGTQIDPNAIVRQVSDPAPHGFKRVPLVCLGIPEEMCIGEQTYDAQLAHFQHDAALSFAIKMCCYPMLVFKAENPEPVTMGTGYALTIGTEEDVDWIAPPTDALQTVARDRDQKRDEIFRVVHQLAQGMDNNAETVGRSADSKEIDAAATRIMLNAYGELVGKAIEETFEIISEARNDADYEWSVEGFSGYDTTTAQSLLAAIEQAKDLGVPSNTFLREISKKAALALLPEVDPRLKQVIRSEIDKYHFEVDGKVLEERILEEQTGSAETISKRTLQSQEKQQDKSIKAQAATAKLAAKAKANQPKPSK